MLVRGSNETTSCGRPAIIPRTMNSILASRPHATTQPGQNEIAPDANDLSAGASLAGETTGVCVPDPRQPVIVVARAAGAPRVLIVDNANRDGWAWAGALRRAGFRLSIADDNEAAWLALESDDHTLLVTIHDSRGFDGLALIRKVRAAGKMLPCLLICDRPAVDAAAIHCELQPGMIMEKPVTIAHFLSTVRTLLSVTPPAHSSAGNNPLTHPLGHGPTERVGP
jgi:hypothetical protein